MPVLRYSIYKDQDTYVLIEETPTGQREIGRHKTRAQALAQQRAIEASKHACGS